MSSLLTCSTVSKLTARVAVTPLRSPPAVSFHVSAPACKKVAGRFKRTPYKTNPLTYEQANLPHQIGVTKTWNSWNTSFLEGSQRKSETQTEDLFIRKFIFGTFHGLFLSEVIIKRRANMIVIGGIISRALVPRKVYFLIGYTEELLSYVLKCPVKIELQTLKNRNDMIFTYV